MKNKEKVEYSILKKLKNDYAFRTTLSSAFSFFMTLIFTIYNLFLGIKYALVWNISIAIYYALLVVFRAYVGYYEIKYYKQNLTDQQKTANRAKVYFLQSIILLILDIALIAPISIMVLEQKLVSFSSVHAIAMAGYTTYRIIMSSINFLKTKHEKNLNIKNLRKINFIDSLVAILSLQYVLIMTFGEGVKDSMLTLCAVTTFSVWIFIIIISIISVNDAEKLKSQINQ